MGPFNFQVDSPKSPVEVLAGVLRVWTPRLNRYGYHLTTQSIGGVTFERRFRPWWTIVLAIVLFPIGLLFLLHRRMVHVTFSFVGQDSGTVITIAGEGERSLKEWLAERTEMPEPGAQTDEPLT